MKTATNDPYRERSVGARRVSTTIYIYRDQRDALRKISADTDVPMAAIVRSGIDRELNARAKRSRR